MIREVTIQQASIRIDSQVILLRRIQYSHETAGGAGNIFPTFFFFTQKRIHYFISASASEIKI